MQQSPALAPFELLSVLFDRFSFIKADKNKNALHVTYINLVGSAATLCVFVAWDFLYPSLRPITDEFRSSPMIRQINICFRSRCTLLLLLLLFYATSAS